VALEEIGGYFGENAMVFGDGDRHGGSAPNEGLDDPTSVEPAGIAC
jgi:hypothetical protein